MTQSIVPKSQHSKQRILGIAVASVFIDYMGIGLVVPLLPFYGKFFGASALEVGGLFGIYFLLGIVAPTIWGELSDRIGRRPALLFNIAGTALSYLWLGLANSLWMLFMARILAGICGASIVIAQSYVADLTTAEKRRKALSFIEAASVIGLVVGPAIGGFLLGSDPTQPNFRLPGLVAAMASGLVFGLALIALPRGVRHINTVSTKMSSSPQQVLANVKQVIKRPLMGTLLIVVFLAMLAFTGIQTVFALWCEQRFGWGPQQFCYLVIYYCLCVITLQVALTKPLSRRFGDIGLLLFSLIVGSFGLFMVPFSQTLPQFLILIFATATEALFHTGRTTLVSQLAGVNQQGKTLGLMQSVMGLSRFLGALLAGYLFGAFGANWPYWIGAVLMIVTTVICWQQLTQSSLSALLRQRRRQKLIHLFNLLDRDQNGTIERQDLQRFGEDLAKLRNWLPDTAKYQGLQTAFIDLSDLLQTLADRDGNQQIDQIEWLHCLEQSQQIDNEFARYFLRIIDANQDNQITLEELTAFYQALGINTQLLKETFDTFDLNQDGHLSPDEFEAIFAQFLYSDDVQVPGNWMFGASLPLKL